MRRSSSAGVRAIATSPRGDCGVGIDDADSENPIAIVHPGPPFLVDPSLKQISYD